MSRPQDIDFNAFARDFALRALADPAAAIADWRTATAGMTADLRSALGRTVNARLERIDTKGAGRSLYIHRGGNDNVADVNTWSAGCQTIPGNAYGDFLATIGRPASFCYVLVDAR